MKQYLIYLGVTPMRLIIPLLILTVLSCKEQEKNKELTADTQERIITVEVVKPIARSFDAEILISGTAHPNKKVKVMAMENGLLTKIYYDIGDRVQRGASLAQLENPEIAHAMDEAKSALALGSNHLLVLDSEVLAAQADLAAKESHYNRLQSIYQQTPQLTPIAEVEKAKGLAEVGRATLSTLKVKIEAQKIANDGLQKNVDFAGARTHFLTIKAPFSGIITQRYVDAGAMIQKGINNEDAQPIVEIQDINPIRLTIPIPQSEATAVKEGMKTRVSFPELPGESYEATISRTSKVLDHMAKTMQVEIDIDNADSKILSGMYAKAIVGLSSRDQVKSLPNTTQTMYQDEPCILVVIDNKIQRITLRKGLTGKDFFEVLNTEITEETLVIVAGKNKVQPGDLVDPIIKNE